MAAKAYATIVLSAFAVLFMFLVPFLAIYHVVEYFKKNKKDS